MSKIKIKSSVRDYEVIFVESMHYLNPYSDKDVVIVDNNVFNRWDNLFSNVSCKIIKIQATEKQKSYEKIGRIIKTLIELGFRKNGKIIAVGGGIVQDICGFISSIMFRGVEWEFYPTTLLAQGDSCIGGKTSVNFGDYKNQLGNFNPPNKIIINSRFIDTLPKQDIRSGVGEMLHYYLVSSDEDFKYYKKEFRAKWGNSYSIGRLVKRCLEIKKRFIEIDEFDKKERLVLNYGHTFGHAIESITNHKIPHGIAISMGMDISNYISMKKSYISQDLYKELNQETTSIWKPEYDMKWSGIDFPKINVEEFIETLKKDKKNISSSIMCVLTKGIGRMFLEEIELNEMNIYLQEYLK